MDKGINGLLALRHANYYKQPQKEELFSYFDTLEQKLLQQSDKLTSLIGVKSLSSFQTLSINDTLTLRHQNSESKIRLFNESINDLDEAPTLKGRGKASIQNHLQNRKNSMNVPVAHYFQYYKEKVSQMQQKLTYNLVQPPEEEYVPESNSSYKSQKVSEVLKKTASSTSSSGALMKAISQIKKMNEKSDENSSQTNKKTRSICIDDFQILKYLQNGQIWSSVPQQVIMISFRHKATNFICAVKKIPKRIFQGETRFINQLVREIKIQSYLDHPNIVQLYTAFSDEKNIYLVLQLCCSGNVYNNLKNEGRFSQQKVKDILKQVSHAVQFMHDSDIIHRDIKPENILLHQAIAKVCDFGWSIHSPLLRETRCGTPLYSSPEAVQNLQYDNKIDVWNIGILAYELMYGRVPFQIRTQQDLVKVVDENIYFPKRIPVTAEAKDFMLKCLVKSPKERLSMTRLIDHPFVIHGNY